MPTPVEERKQPADRAEARRPAHEFDAIVLVSFGGPEGPDDVMPFLENVTRGRNVPRERLLDVAHHYELFGGVSPINEQNRALIAALEPELRRRGVDLPIYFGNRNWHPFLADTMRQMTDDGIGRALAVFTSAFSSYSGCRQYREDLFNAQRAAGPGAPEVPRARMFFNHPGFVAANVDRVRDALAELDVDDVHIAFTAHSIPSAMAANCAYEAQLREAARLVAEEVGVGDWAVAYQSRSGSPQVPWLEPDIGDHLRAAARARRAGRRDLADRLRLRPPRGALRPRRRGSRARGRARAADGARGHGRHASGFRRGARRPDRRADDAGRAPAGARPVRPEPRRLRAGLLPAGHRAPQPVGLLTAGAEEDERQRRAGEHRGRQHERQDPDRDQHGIPIGRAAARLNQAPESRL